MVVLKDEYYYAGFWFIAAGQDPFCTSESEVDFLACIYKESVDPKDPNVPWKIYWRTRRYNDDKVFDSNDIKDGGTYTMPGKTTEEEAIKKMATVALTVKNLLGTELFSVRSLSGKQFQEWLFKQPFSHKREITKEEANELIGEEIFDESNLELVPTA